MPDCGSNSCRYVIKRTGQRTNGMCTCDRCRKCGKDIRLNQLPFQHREWCPIKEWVPEHQLTKVLEEVPVVEK